MKLMIALLQTTPRLRAYPSKEENRGINNDNSPPVEGWRVSAGVVLYKTYYTKIVIFYQV
jgi:hypothetical protein